MKKFLIVGFICIFHHVLSAQCLIPSNTIDTLFPVTNRFNTAYSSSGKIVYDFAPSIFNIIANNGKYFLFGNFTHLAANQGSALVVDTLSNTVVTTQKWRVKGLVHTSIADDKGGFFIGGDFSSIGDTSRKYLAQINSSGEPTSWHPKLNGTVKALHKRNDTLFIAGSFTRFGDKDRYCMALYSISGDSIISNAGGFGPFASMLSINAFQVQNDTLIFGGRSGTGEEKIRKYNFKDSLFLPWRLQFAEYGEIKFLQLVDDSTLIYASNYNGEYIKGVNHKTGLERYAINVSMYWPDGANTGTVYGMKALGNKVYAVGHFEHILPKSGIVSRKGFFAFDALSGTLLTEDLQLDGYPVFLDTFDNKLCISGKFSSVRSINKENFAVIDTGTLAVNRWDLSPSDPLTSLAFSSERAFVSGHFNGVHSIRRNGFAAYDTATKTVLPWNPVNDLFIEGKRAFAKGDTLFVLGITSRPSSCMVNDFNTAFQLYSLSSGLRIATPHMNFSRMDDCVIEGDYLYVSVDQELRRFILPSLTKDPSWGVSFRGAGSEHNPIHIIVEGDKVYSVGDNRFVQKCTTLPLRKGWFIVYNKATGIPKKYFSYEGKNNLYDPTLFEHAILTDNRLYVQGHFKELNGKSRPNFACLDINSGEITNWIPAFPASWNVSYFDRASNLKLYNGKLWFGAPYANQGQFPGFIAIDTATGTSFSTAINHFKPIAYKEYENAYYGFLKYRKTHDFIFENNHLVLVGDFDFINGHPSSNLSRVPLVNGQLPVNSTEEILGVNKVLIGTDTAKFYITNSPSYFTYTWTYSGSGVDIINNGKDTICLNVKMGATNGKLTVQASSFCSTGGLVQKDLIVEAPLMPTVPAITNIVDQCFNSQNARGKITNPPAGIEVIIERDGLPLSFNPADSTFQYFTTGGLSIGAHTITVKFKNGVSVSQKDSVFSVLLVVVPRVQIAASETSVCKGVPVTFNAMSDIGGLNPSFQWLLNGNKVGTNTSSFVISTLNNNDQVVVLLTSNAACPLTKDAKSNTITVAVNAEQKAAATITGATTVNQGAFSMLTASSTNGGSAPTYQWQDSTQNHSWQNISGATASVLNYKPTKTGDKVRCSIISNMACVTTKEVTSNELSFIVNPATAIPNVSIATYGLQVFPNPVESILYVDQIKVSDKWRTLEIMSINGKRSVISTTINNQTKLEIPVKHLTAGIYIMVFTRQSGEKAYFMLVKK